MAKMNQVGLPFMIMIYKSEEQTLSEKLPIFFSSKVVLVLDLDVTPFFLDKEGVHC